LSVGQTVSIGKVSVTYLSSDANGDVVDVQNSN